MSSCQVNGSSPNHGSCPSDPGPSNGAGENSGTSPEPGAGECDMDHQPSVAEHSPEVLGSVVQNHELENGDKNSFIQLRTSARVSKKMRLDFIASQTPPDKKDIPKEEDKLDTKPKRRPFELWPQEDKNTFFEALNEYGKDFDAIQRFFEAKAKRKNLPDHTAKNKEQIRHFYYRTWHKISKHLRFPDEVKKATQELYGLINFGELRKKIGTVSEKTSWRLSELIYRGFTQIRVRGKTIRIKTPICRALRKLNQQEELAEELKLPARVTVELKPRTNEAWARVQSVAQNPRVRTLLPLQRRLASLLTFLEQRWQLNHIKHCERLQSQLNEVSANIDALETGSSSSVSPNDEKPSEKSDSSPVLENKPDINSIPSFGRLGSNQVLRVAPKAGATISPLTVNLSEYFTSTRLSLNSHEGRLGNHAAEELFNSMLLAANKSCGKKGAKRVRHDSGSEKKKDPQLHHQIQPAAMSVDSSPEKSKDGSSSTIVSQENEDVKPSGPFRLFGTGVSMDSSLNSADLGNCDLKAHGEKFPIPPNSLKDKSDSTPISGALSSLNCLNPVPSGSKDSNQNQINTPSESNEEIISRIRAGWMLGNAKAVTIGELYLMFGADSKVQLEYWWESSTSPDKQSNVDMPVEAVSPDRSNNNSSQPLALALQKLLDLAKTYSNSKLVQCPCGHTCNGTPKPAGPKPKVPRPVRSNLDNDKTVKSEACVEKTNTPNNVTKILSPMSVSDGPFRRPLMPSPQFKPPPRPGTADAFKAQLEKFRPRFCNRRGRPVSVRKNVVVPRMLPLLPKAPSSSSLVTLQVIPQKGQMTGEFVPIAQSPSVLHYTSVPPSITSPAGRQIPSMMIDSTSPASSFVNQSSTSSTPDLTSSGGDIAVINLCPGGVLQSSAETPLSASSALNEEKGFGLPPSTRVVQDPFPPTLDTPVNSPPSISNLLDMSLPSELNLTSNSLMETNFSGLLPNSSGISSSPPPASPSSLLKEDENQWLNAEVSDFSLSSFLGHLESPMKPSASLTGNIEQHSMTSDVEAQMQCLMAENSLDYMTKFADLAAQIASEGANKS